MRQEMCYSEEYAIKTTIVNHYYSRKSMTCRFLIIVNIYINICIFTILVLIKLRKYRNKSKILFFFN